MNLRHAAALALVGWYLMQPPSDNSHGRPDSDAPLPQWQESGSFDSAAKCNKERFDTINTYEKLLAEAQKSKSSGRDIDTAQNGLLAFLKAQCIATDDPRLKEK
jgi:hypothetical protein